MACSYSSGVASGLEATHSRLSCSYLSKLVTINPFSPARKHERLELPETTRGDRAVARSVGLGWKDSSDLRLASKGQI